MLRNKKGTLVAALALTTFFAAGFLWPKGGFTKDRSLCSFRLAFGQGCPGCGMTRSVTSFLRGDLERSVEMHLFGPVIVGVAATLWFVSVFSLVSRDPIRMHFHARSWTVGLIAFLVLYVGYWVYRLITHTTPV